MVKEVWRRYFQQSCVSGRLFGGQDSAAEIASFGNSRWVARLPIARCLAHRTSLDYQCDEGKPQCKRCSSFGLLCNFMSNTPDLQPAAADAGRPMVVRGRAELRPPPTNAVWTSDASTTYQLNAKCQDFITRYLGRSLTNPDDPNMTQVNRKLLKLAFAVRSVRSVLSRQ